MLNQDIDSQTGKDMRPLDGPFKFACNPGVDCFTECCRDLDLTLTPYDLLRLKKNLQVTTEDFIEKYASYDFSHKMGFPTIKLKMEENERKTCPFVGPQGCEVYEDRPSACRTYPLARATQKYTRYGKIREAYFVLRESHCLGFDAGKVWTLDQWKKDQGLEEYNRMNDGWAAVVCSPFAEKRGGLSEKEIQLVYMSAYNIELFRRFVFGSSLLNKFEIDRERIRKIEAEDEELLLFAFDWLRFALFGESTLRLNQHG